MYISLFFCKNVGAVQHAHTHPQALFHGHFSLPKSNDAEHRLSSNTDQTLDFGLIQDFDVDNDLEIEEDNTLLLMGTKLNWLSNYLSHLLLVISAPQSNTPLYYSLDTIEIVQAPIYVLNQVFRI